MALDTLQGASQAIGQMERAVMQDPLSPEAALSVEATVRNIEVFLASPEVQTFLRLPRDVQSPLPPQFGDAVRRLFRSLQGTHSVAVQIEQLGGRVDWIVPLEHALDRLRRVLAGLGASADLGWTPGPPIVSRLGINPDGSLRLNVSTKAHREPRLAPYIAAALREAHPSEIEPGHWYAELERFPGVWADGVTPHACLEELGDALHEWLVLKAVLGDQDIPVLDNLDPRTLILPIRNA